MSTLVQMEGLLEAVEIEEPYQAALHNLGAIIRAETGFYLATNAETGQQMAFNVHKLIAITDNGYTE